MSHIKTVPDFLYFAGPYIALYSRA